MKNKFSISLLVSFSVLMLLLCISVSADAVEHGKCGTDFNYVLEDNGTLTVSGSGKMPDWSSYQQVPWHSKRDSIKNVIITSGVTSIGNFAFFNCPQLEAVNIPDGIKSIGNSAFYYCNSLKNVTLPDSVISIGNWSFSYCTGLTNIIIPAATESIGYQAFYCCTGLEKIAVDYNNKSYSSDSTGVLFNKDKTTIIRYPAGNTNYLYRIPSSVKNIDNYAFSHCDALGKIVIPDSVTKISKSAFLNTSYFNDAENWENGVLYIGKHLIASKSSLSGNYTVKAGTKTIADNAFYDCYALTSITIPDSVTSIGMSLASCEKIIVDSNNESYSSDETGVLFNKDKTILLKYPSKNKNTSYTIPSSVQTIADYAFACCNNLTEITFGADSRLTSISTGAFHDCYNIETVTMPYNVTSIGDYVFDSCYNLKSITIPNIAASVGNYTFFSCSGLTITGHGGSTSQSYAENNRIPFTALAIIYGDIKGDGTVDVSDVIFTLQLLASGNTEELCESQKTAADVNGDGKTDVSDIIRVLQYLASSGSSSLNPNK